MATVAIEVEAGVWTKVMEGEGEAYLTSGEPFFYRLNSSDPIDVTDGHFVEWKKNERVVVPAGESLYLYNHRVGFTVFVSNLDGDVFIAPNVPDAFEVGDWAVVDEESGNTLEVTVSTLPSDGGATITGIRYMLNGGASTAFSPPLDDTGVRNITGLLDDQPYDVQLIAVNGVGTSVPSDTKNATPTDGS